MSWKDSHGLVAGRSVETGTMGTARTREVGEGADKLTRSGVERNCTRWKPNGARFIWAGASSDGHHHTSLAQRPFLSATALSRDARRRLGPGKGRQGPSFPSRQTRQARSRHRLPLEGAVTSTQGDTSTLARYGKGTRACPEPMVPFFSQMIQIQGACLAHVLMLQNPPIKNMYF